MENIVGEEVRENQLFMMAQFVDVMNTLESYSNIEEIKEEVKKRKKNFLEHIQNMEKNNDYEIIDLSNKSIETKVENCSEIYTTNKEYKRTIKKLDSKYKKIEQKLENKDKEKLKEVKELIKELNFFDINLAYKIGLLDGMKIKKIKTT